MTNKQISTFLNGAIKTNMLGESTAPLAEDMSNYIDFGKSLASLTDNDLKDFKQRLAVQIRNYVIERILDRKDFGMFKDSAEYAGALQRIVSNGLLQTQDSHLVNLVNGTDYMDGKYYGVNIDSKVYTNIDSFKVAYSISDDDWRLAFESVSEMRRVISLIYNAEKNTITAYLNALTKRIYIAMIENCNTSGRKIGLLTKFNEMTGGNPATSKNYTIKEIYADRKLYAYFADFVKGLVSKLQVYVQEMNERYNDGTVTTFTPKEDIELVAVTDFLNDIKFIGQPVDYNTVDFNVREVSAWQTTTNDMLPTLADVTHLELTGGNIDGVVMLVYDKMACGIENVADKITTQYVGSEGFETFFHHLVNRYFYDTRFGSIILTLD